MFRRGQAGHSAVVMFACVMALASHGASAVELPGWVTSPPPDTAMVMYGVGDGGDRDSAKAAALAAIAGTLMTKVQSSTSVNQRQDKSGFTEQVAVTVQTKVRDTALSHYKVADAKKVSRRWWVLVELDRSALIEDALADLETTNQSLAKAMSRYNGLSRLEQYLDQDEARTEIDAAWAALEFARSASYTFQGESYVERYQEYEDQVARSLRNLSVRIDGDEASSVFAQKLANLLARKNIRAIIGRAESGSVLIRVNSTVREFDIGSSKQVRMTILLTTIDERGRQLASIERAGVGESLMSYESAQRQASNKLARECEEKGVLTYLGL